MYKYQVIGYASDQHPAYPDVKFGDILLITNHFSDVSKDIEVSVWRDRMAKGEVAYVDVIKLDSPVKRQRIHA